MFKTVGLVCAKENSIRFPNKNKFILDDVPMFWHSVVPLIQSSKVDKVFVLTNDHFIKMYCEDRDVDVIWRNVNIGEHEQPLLDVLRYGYFSLQSSYDYVITIMANCPFHKNDSVDKMIEMMYINRLKEVRSFNSEGLESGMMMFDSSVIKYNTQISSHIGKILSDVVEIEYKEDLTKINYE